MAKSWNLGPESLQIVDQITELRVLVSGRTVRELKSPKHLLKDRRKLAEMGVGVCADDP
jgi:mRNA degradation ribonuclease J1/J2